VARARISVDAYAGDGPTVNALGFLGFSAPQVGAVSREPVMADGRYLGRSGCAPRIASKVLWTRSAAKTGSSGLAPALTKGFHERIEVLGEDS
jgi:hypothetical protein